MSEIRKAVLRFTRREVGKVLAVALGLGLLPRAADAFRPHSFSGGAVGSSPGTITTFILVWLGEVPNSQNVYLGYQSNSGHAWCDGTSWHFGN
jgi:hypothetical protein